MRKLLLIEEMGKYNEEIILPVKTVSVIFS